MPSLPFSLGASAWVAGAACWELESDDGAPLGLVVDVERGVRVGLGPVLPCGTGFGAALDARGLGVLPAEGLVASRCRPWPAGALAEPSRPAGTGLGEAGATTLPGFVVPDRAGLPWAAAPESAGAWGAGA